MNTLLKLFPILFYSLLVIFLAIYLQTLDWSTLSTAELSWGYALIATVFALAMRFWGAYVWFVLLKSLGAANLSSQKAQLVYVYAKTWLGRYIPGTAPWILGKIYFASKHGISKNKLAVSSLLEGALQIVVTLVLAFAILLFDRRLDVIDDGFKVLMAVILVGCIVAIVPAVFNRLIALAYKIIRRKTFPAEHMAGNATILRGTGLYVIGAIFSGLSFFFIAKAVYAPLGYDQLLFVFGASNLASAIGMLALFAPSGIGVREGIQVLLLSLIMPVEFALLIAVVTRLWSIIADAIFYFSTVLLRRVFA